MSTPINITAAHLEIIYRIMLKRIGKGYSAERLSFLIGKEHNYIKEVESLVLPVYSGDELDGIAMALEESNPKSFYSNVYDESPLSIAVDQHHQKTKLVHVYSRVDEKEEKWPVFMLREDLFGDLDDAPHHTENTRIAEAAVELLLWGGYFLEAKRPFEILHSINAFLTNPIHPFYVELAILSLCDDGDKEGSLKKIENITDGFSYEEG